jgi:1-acyl-sn-glycerol-3-phosphate acyltransferase
MDHQVKRERAIEEADKTAVTLLDVVRELAAELHPHQWLVAPVTLDSSLDRDLGLDSLARMELLARIERSFEATLPERAFAEAETPRDLLRALLSASSGRAPGPIPEVTRVDTGEAQGAPHSARTLIEVLNWHVQTHPDRPHIQLYSDGAAGDILTYRQLFEGAKTLASGLQLRGLQPGEPVALMLPTGRDYFCMFYGVLLAGGIPVPLYPPARRAQMEDHLRRHRSILTNCGAAVLITIPEGRRFAQLLKSQVETLRSLVTVEELCSASGAYQEPALGGHDVAFLQYTSGSTGNPKGVVLSHANLLANIRAMGNVVEVNAADVFVSWLPLYHDMGLIGAWLGSLYYAALLVSMSPLEFIARPQRWLWAIHHWRATLSAAPNFAYELCLRRVCDEDLDKLDLRCWRAAFNGAEPVSPTTVEKFCERFSQCGFAREAMMPVYGLAESSVGLAFPPLKRGPVIDKIQRDPLMHDGKAIPTGDADLKALYFVACGRPLPGHEIRVTDASSRELPERLEGHLQFRGPSSCSGYYRNAEQTRNLFHGDWLDTGDRAYIANGDVYITGRSKDIIIRAGRNIYPHELEEAIGNIPGIRKGNVAVFASAEPSSGTERLVVLAETRESAPERLDALRSQAGEVAIDLVGTPPDDIILTPPQTLLKTSSGKIRRSANRDLYQHGQLGKRPRAAGWQVLRIAMAAVIPEVRRARRVSAEKLYAIYCWGLFGLLAPLVWLLVITLPHFSWRWSLLRGATRFLSWASCAPILMHGLDNLPRDRPCVLVANHASYIDSLILTACLPRTLSFVAKAELAAMCAIRLFLSRLRTEFVERFDRQKGIEDARRIVGRVRAGQSVLFFAEGTFCRMPGLLPFHMGAFLTATDAGVPVVPIAIRGTRSILRDGSWLPRRGTITVTIGKPTEPEAIKAQGEGDSWKIALRLCDAAREHILCHCGEPDLAHEKSPI